MIYETLNIGDRPINSDFLGGGVNLAISSIMGSDYDCRTIGGAKRLIRNELFASSTERWVQAANHGVLPENGVIKIPCHGQRSQINLVPEMTDYEVESRLQRQLVFSQRPYPHRFKPNKTKFNYGSDILKAKISDKMPILPAYSADCVTMSIRHKSYIYVLHAGLEGITNGTIEKVFQDIINDGIDLNSLKMEIPPALWLVTIPKGTPNYNWVKSHKELWERTNLTYNSNSKYPVYEDLDSAIRANKDIPDTFRIPETDLIKSYHMQKMQGVDSEIFMANVYLYETLKRYISWNDDKTEKNILFYPQSTILSPRMHSYRGARQPAALMHGNLMYNSKGQIIYNPIFYGTDEDGKPFVYSNNVVAVSTSYFAKIKQ